MYCSWYISTNNPEEMNEGLFEQFCDFVVSFPSGDRNVYIADSMEVQTV